MRRIFILCFFFFSCHVFAQNFGIRIGVTTSTPTGNHDAFGFDFLESFSPRYEGGFFGRFRLSDVIIIKPEISYREYSVKQIMETEIELLNLEQTHRAISSDLNFDVELNSYLSLIFGVGFDYIIWIQTSTMINSVEQINNIDLSGLKNNDRITPFNNIGLCFKIGRNILLDLEYRHLLENLSLGDLENNQLIDLKQGNVKLHMINFSIGILF